MTIKFDIVPRDVPKKITKHVKIVTKLPNPVDYQIIKRCIENEPSSMNNQLPIVWSKAIDYQVMDSAGNTWIDFTSCIFVANVGHSNPQVVEAMRKTIDKGLLNAYYYPTEERSEFTKNLLDCVNKGDVNFDKVLLLSTGSEAVEAAIKMSILKNSRDYPEKRKIISYENSFHGKTMGSQMTGGKIKEKSWIRYQHPDIINIPFPYPWILEMQKKTGEEFFQDTVRNLEESGIKAKDIAAFITEPYQGWCAVFLPEDYMKSMRNFCDKNDCLIIIDEVQSGFGRTGKLFAYEHFGIRPDIVVCGKGISSSLPLSAVLTREDIIQDNQSFNSTHGGNPIAVSASNASLNFLQSNFLVKESERKGKLLEKLLLDWQSKNSDYIKSVYVKGLLASVFLSSNSTEISNEDFTDRLIEKAFYKGLISVRTSSGTLKIGPPLTIPDDALIEGIQILKDSLSEMV